MPLSPFERIRLDKAAVDEGFGLKRPDDGEWLVYAGLGTPAIVRMTFREGEYIIAVNHVGVVADLAQRWPHWNKALPDERPAAFTAFTVGDTEPLHQLLGEVRRLARALPNEPLRIFESETKSLPRSTEAERLVIQRVGQNIFRDALLTYWGGRCAVTGVGDSRLLRASHIKPWAECASDADRLDVYNGLLLAANVDAAFDAGLVTFTEDGSIVFSAEFMEADRDGLGVDSAMKLRRVAPGHLPNLEWHRERVLRK